MCASRTKYTVRLQVENCCLKYNPYFTLNSNAVYNFTEEPHRKIICTQDKIKLKFLDSEASQGPVQRWNP